MADQTLQINHSHLNVFHNLPQEVVAQAADQSLVQEVAHQPPRTRHKPLQTQPTSQAPPRQMKVQPTQAQRAEAVKARMIQTFQMKTKAQPAARKLVQIPMAARLQTQIKLRQLEQRQKRPLAGAALKKMTQQTLGQLLKIKAAHVRSNQIQSSLHSLIKIQIHNLKIHPPTQVFHYLMFQTRKKKLATRHPKLRGWRRSPSMRRCLAIGARLIPHNMSPILLPADLINPFSLFVPLNDPCRSIEVGERQRNLSLPPNCAPHLI